MTVQSRDWMVGLTLSIATVIVSWTLSGTAMGALGATESGVIEVDDVWFSSDVGQNTAAIGDRGADQFQTAHHPLSALLVRVPFRLAQGLVDRALVIRSALAIAGAVWMALLFATLRSIGCGLFAAVVFALIALASASSLAWLAVPDFFLPGAVTTLPLLLYAAHRQRGTARDWHLVLLSVLSFTMTSTNVMFGIAACAVLLPPRRALQALVNAAALALGLWVLQWWIYPESRFLIGDTTYDHRLLPSDLPTSLRTVVDFLVHAVVMPAVAVDLIAEPHRLTMHTALPGTAGAAGLVATCLWLLLFGAGASSLWGGRRQPHAMLLMLVVSGQFVLHLVFAETETFLFSPHFMSLLVLIAAWGSVRPAMRAMLPLALLLLGAMVMTNVAEWQRCLALARSLTQ